MAAAIPAVVSQILVARRSGNPAQAHLLESMKMVIYRRPAGRVARVLRRG
jgi:hypothetical protein